MEQDPARVIEGRHADDAAPEEVAEAVSTTWRMLLKLRLSSSQTVQLACFGRFWRQEMVTDCS
jgi:hypothetical protein